MNKSDFYKQAWEYLLIISPPEDIKHSIGKIKKEVALKYGNPLSLHSTAHISLIKFQLAKGFERNLLTQLFGFCINALPFDVTLKNFDVFPRHTLYVRVQENEGLGKLQNRLMILLMNLISAHNRQISESRKHYMTIARNLESAQFNSVSNEYRSKRIDTSFSARNIVLLKRQYDKYKPDNYRWNGSHNFVLGVN